MRSFGPQFCHFYAVTIYQPYYQVVNFNMLTKSPACMLLQPTCQATAGLSLLKALTANRIPQRSSFAKLVVLARPSARPIRPVLSSAASDVVSRASGEDDDDDWDLHQEFGEPEPLGEEEAFGPPVGTEGLPPWMHSRAPQQHLTDQRQLLQGNVVSSM